MLHCVSGQLENGLDHFSPYIALGPLAPAGCLGGEVVRRQRRHTSAKVRTATPRRPSAREDRDRLDHGQGQAPREAADDDDGQR